MNNMTETDWRTLIIEYLNGIYKEDEILNIINGERCVCCGCVDLTEYMHENEDGIYCNNCWESRD